MKSIFYRWYEPEGYHKFTLENTEAWDDFPGNQFKICVYLEGELLASSTIDAHKTYNPRRTADTMAIDWFEELRAKGAK
ncbi:hypothetical protein [Microcoleus sp. bin38.metabat.b11b12b14.051]|uniref:hypothetical protein n=1 Tax=Microcoleus sp. bin38.metabat.b11b12b14.051 TaxID=2742709 RepID=UPI0025D4B589|nr:hypothetical protein [Microcoleus sp. bin38.metabat.b11b12b14.051]